MILMDVNSLEGTNHQAESSEVGNDSNQLQNDDVMVDQIEAANDIQVSYV